MSPEHLQERCNEAPVCAVFDRCRASPSPAAVRDAALLSVFFGAGFDLTTVAALDRSDYQGDGLLRTPEGRWLRAHAGARECLDDWCWLRGEGPGPLFPPVGGGGTVTCRRPSTDSLMEVIRHRMTAAGVGEWDPRALAVMYRSPWWEAVGGRSA